MATCSTPHLALVRVRAPGEGSLPPVRFPLVSADGLLGGSQASLRQSGLEPGYRLPAAVRLGSCPGASGGLAPSPPPTGAGRACSLGFGAWRFAPPRVPGGARAGRRSGVQPGPGTRGASVAPPPPPAGVYDAAPPPVPLPLEAGRGASGREGDRGFRNREGTMGPTPSPRCVPSAAPHPQSPLPSTAGAGPPAGEGRQGVPGMRGGPGDHPAPAPPRAPPHPRWRQGGRAGPPPVPPPGTVGSAGRWAPRRNRGAHRPAPGFRTALGPASIPPPCRHSARVRLRLMLAALAALALRVRPLR